MKRSFVFIFLINFGTAFCQTGDHLWDVFALNSDTAFACSEKGSFYRTIDGGDTWEIFQEISGMDKALSKVYFIDKKHGWMTSSYGGYIFKTNDCGSSWDLNSYSFDKVYDLVFQDSLRGWVCGSQIMSSGLGTYEVRHLMKTEDGGRIWTYQKAGGRTISFSTENTVWLGSRYDDHYGLIEKSNDGGETWDVQEIPQVLSIEKIFFFNDKIGWAVGNKYTTKNGVSYWVTQLLHTVDGGETWELQNDDFEVPINYIHFINDSSGFAIHRYQLDHNSPAPSYISATSDGGYNWDLHSIYSPRLGGIHFVDEETGWIVGEYSLILKTNDGGMNWVKQENFVFINNPDTVDTTDVTDTTDNNYIPENIELIQNYPNPFNSSTKIDYSVPVPSIVRLIVYDILGNEIETLVSQYQEANRYSTVFNGDKISSGLYFYTLTVDDKYFNTKKMLLIR